MLLEPTQKMKSKCQRDSKRMFVISEDVLEPTKVQDGTGFQENRKENESRVVPGAEPTGSQGA